jgi:hypothetical protein
MTRRQGGGYWIEEGWIIEVMKGGGFGSSRVASPGSVVCCGHTALEHRVHSTERVY